MSSHLHVIKGLELLRNWLRNHYLVEATVEWRHLQLHGGSLDRLPFPSSYEDQQPGNESPFYRSRGIHPNEIEPTPENAPQVANAMLEALAHHNCQQSEARDHQEYQRQQGNTESLMADFPSPTPVDWDEPTDLEGLEGATVALQPSSPTTTAPQPSSSTTSAPAKKKVISIEEYNCHKATERQLASAYLDRDENREDLDYEDFESQDDPANIQIGYWMPTPVPQIADLPPLQDTTSSASQLAATPAAPNVTIPMPQGSTGPGTVLGTTVHHVAPAANRAPSFGRGLPVARASPMQVGTPASLSFTYAGHNTGSLTARDPQSCIDCRGRTSARGYLAMLSLARGQPAEPTGSTDRQSYQDDGRPSPLGLLQPTVHLWVGGGPA